MRTSGSLKQSTVYTRKELQERFEIKDATINTGIFQPKGHDSIWLFVTETKTPDRVPYDDRLEGNDLYMEGQLAGLKDELLIQHKEKGLEVLVFYRKHKYEHEFAGFVYEGQFEYVNHRGTRPAKFHFRRVKS